MKHKNLSFAYCQLPIAFCLLLIASCPLPITSFAQNTFRYKVCPAINLPLPYWEVGPVSARWQIPSDSGYIGFGDGAKIILPPGPNTPSDSLDWGCFAATKLDKYGNQKWIRIYQEVSNLTHKGPHDGIPTADSGFIMAGGKTLLGNPGYNGTNTYVQKMDKDGHIVWAKQYKITSNNENSALKIRQMPDGGYIVMGQTKDILYSTPWHDSYNIYLLRLDKDGKNLWCYSYDAKKNGEETAASLDLANDGGFIIGATAVVDSNAGFNQNTLIFGYKGLMMKVNGDGTSVEWARRYGAAYDGNYQSFSDFFYEVKQTSDGGYIGVGNTGGISGWVVKTNAQGIIEWQKTYDTPAIATVEELNDGYLLGSTETQIYSATGGDYGRLTKISKKGEVEWSKLYDTPFSALSLTSDNGFLLNMGGGFVKTNSSGEFDNGCIYNGALSSRVDVRTDTLYLLNPVLINLTPSNIVLNEHNINRQICPVVCGISNKAVAPSYSIGSPTITICANTDASLRVNPNFDIGVTNFSYYKLNFGDPASGARNNITGSSMSYSEQVIHNYSYPGTYTITTIVYNGDYSESDTSSYKITVIPKLKYTLLTPEINCCKEDTGTIVFQLEDYTQGVYAARIYDQTGSSILSTNTTINDGTATIVGTVLPDAVNSFYVIDGGIGGSGGCAIRDTVRVITGHNKALIKGDTKICREGTSTLQATGGDSYLWSTGATSQTITASPASNTTYWVEATTTDACRDTAYVYVKVMSEINVDVTTRKKAVCAGDVVTLYATGANNYTWNNGSTTDSITTVTVNGPNTFTVTGTSAACSDAASITITADTKPLGSVSTAPSKACMFSEYTLTASGGDRYYWAWGLNGWGDLIKRDSGAVQTFKVGVSGQHAHAVYVYNGGCADIVERWSPLPLSSPTIKSVETDECRVCPGTQVTLRKYFYPVSNPNGDQDQNNYPYNQGLTYQWSTGHTNSNLNDSIKITVNRDTLITLTTTNSYGCSNIVSTFIEAGPHFFIKKNASPVPSCGNTPTTLYLTGGSLFDFIWSNGSTRDTIVVSPLQDTMFYITATANGCTRTDSIWIMAKSNLPKARINGDSIVCKGSPGTYSASGSIIAETYKWLTGNITDTQSSLTTPIAANTTLKVVVGFPGACTDTAEYKINVVDIPHALISGDTLICPGGTSSLKASGGYTYKWSDGSTEAGIDVKPTNDMTISLYASSGNCSDTATVTVQTNQTITATIFSDEDTTCTGTPLTLIAGGGDNYTWSSGGNEAMLGILPVTTTTYTVTVTTEDNCKDTKSITIQVSPAPDAQISSARVCQGDSLILTASGGSRYLWNTGNVNASLILINPMADSVYRVKVSVGSCNDSAQAKVSILPKPLVDAGADVSINYGNDVPLFATGTGTYLWSPAIGLSCTDCASPLAEPSRSTLYYIILKDANGCKSIDSVMVFVDLPCGDVFVPTAFSPNNDGINDIFYIRGRCIQSMNLMIYDRWGEKVFEALSTTKGWDGTYNGKPMNVAIFVFSLEATLTNGELLSRKGNVVLMK